MKNYLKAMVLFSVFFLAGCNSIKVDESGQSIDNFLSNYSLKVSSNSDSLYFSTDISTEEYLNRGEAGIIKAGYFINSAHRDFVSYQDVLNPEFWYYQIENTEDAEKLPIDAFDSQINDKTYYFAQEITFGMMVQSDNDEEEYDVNIESITFPEVNVFSVIFLGNEGYQERLSNGDEVAGNNLFSHVKSNEQSTISFIMYLNGNDPLVTNENIEYINNNMKGVFDIKIGVTKTDK